MKATEGVLYHLKNKFFQLALYCYNECVYNVILARLESNFASCKHNTSIN